MSAKYVLISSYPLKSDIEMSVVKKIPRINDSKNFYMSEELGTNELLELRAYDNLNALCNDEALFECDFKSFMPYLDGDISREIVKFVEAPITSKHELPRARYIQLRHVEVPPEKYEAYRAWRAETIFKVVHENKDKITSFSSYHSLISGHPGVMFVSAFDVDKDVYVEPFVDDRYKKIIRDADNYITNKHGGLYTRIYRSINH
ncbi:hypothetical protein NLZ15_18395 [Atlantibacter subterranea]|uniref:hypothetical protein n=1 Tax=Atlantibacter subterraneus TaxID=255519 RepID=UPI0020C30FCC|nr:hypothetical protein [Atlantibacter subterranea]UTJ46773.1 hypothetical protein NLZ15_18395 [Atlantibacter subterranea]